MVSAKAMPSEQVAGIQAGANDYITKPVDEVDLLELSRGHCLSPAKKFDIAYLEEKLDDDVASIS